MIGLCIFSNYHLNHSEKINFISQIFTFKLILIETQTLAEYICNIDFYMFKKMFYSSVEFPQKIDALNTI